MLRQTPKMEAGRVFLPEHADWLTDFLDAMAHFPRGHHDDQVNSVSQALEWMAGKPEYTGGFR